MNSNSNLPSSAAEPGRNITGRLVRFLGRRVRGVWRFVFSRRMVWTLAILASLLVLLYQYEDWNGARELAEARKKMIARIGTENYLDLLPEEVPEAENFYAIDEIKSWRVPSEVSAGGFHYAWPSDGLFPAGFIEPPLKEDDGQSSLDLDEWVQRRKAGGKPLLDGEDPVNVLRAELGYGSGIIQRLASGLDRPYSQIIPCARRNLLEAGGDPAASKITSMGGVFSTMRNLGIHLRVAALSGDRKGTFELSEIMMRLSGLGDGSEFLPVLVALAMDDITFRAFSETLGCGHLTGADYRKIQEHMLSADDCRRLERMFKTSVLAGDFIQKNMSRAAIQGDYQPYQRWLGDIFGKPDQKSPVFRGLWMLPSGWMSSNHAFVIEGNLALCGDGGEESWRSGTAGINQVMSDMVSSSAIWKSGDFSIPNPRRIVAVAMLPAMSNVWKKAGENLFRRRCAILTCALHRHRLAHGGFPGKLAELDAAFLPEPMKDPAKAGALLDYRKVERGFLLWSVGEDRNDDGGDAGKDWIWRHEKGG